MPEQVLERAGFIVVGAVLSWLFQQYRVLRAEDSALINEHIKDIEKFRDQAVEYWLAVPDAKLPAEGEADIRKMKDMALAAKVRAAHAATTIPYPRIAALSGKREAEYKQTSQELYSLATGGEFEGGRSGIDPQRAILIFDTSAQLINFLREVRRETVSLWQLGVYFIAACRRNWTPWLLFVALVLISMLWLGVVEGYRARPAEVDAAGTAIAPVPELTKK
jgi:hypothetical protein